MAFSCSVFLSTQESQRKYFTGNAICGKAALCHQIGILQRSVKRPKLTTVDRLLWVWLCTVWQEWQCSVFIIKASTVLGWHRNAFRVFWTWKIRRGKVG